MSMAIVVGSSGCRCGGIGESLRGLGTRRTTLGRAMCAPAGGDVQLAHLVVEGAAGQTVLATRLERTHALAHRLDGAHHVRPRVLLVALPLRLLAAGLAALLLEGSIGVWGEGLLVAAIVGAIEAVVPLAATHPDAAGRRVLGRRVLVRMRGRLVAINDQRSGLRGVGGIGLGQDIAQDRCVAVAAEQDARDGRQLLALEGIHVGGGFVNGVQHGSGSGRGHGPLATALLRRSAGRWSRHMSGCQGRLRAGRTLAARRQRLRRIVVTEGGLIAAELGRRRRWRAAARDGGAGRDVGGCGDHGRGVAVAVAAAIQRLASRRARGGRGTGAGAGVVIELHEVVVESLDLQLLGGAQDLRLLALGHRRLARVHVLQQGRNLEALDPGQDDAAVILRHIAQDVLEIRRVGRQDNAMGLELLVVHDQGAVHIAAHLVEGMQDLYQVRLVVVPAQAVRLTHLTSATDAAAAGDRAAGRCGAAHLLVVLLLLLLLLVLSLVSISSAPGLSYPLGIQPGMMMRVLVGLLVGSVVTGVAGAGAVRIVDTVQAGKGGAQQRRRVEG